MTSGEVHRADCEREGHGAYGSRQRGSSRYAPRAVAGSVQRDVRRSRPHAHDQPGAKRQQQQRRGRSSVGTGAEGVPYGLMVTLCFDSSPSSAATGIHSNAAVSVAPMVHSLNIAPHDS